jgi:hypothetical protein
MLCAAVIVLIISVVLIILMYNKIACRHANAYSKSLTLLLLILVEKKSGGVEKFSDD